MLASSVALGGEVRDTDADLVPDGFDNCLYEPNGPNELSNQVDTDQDGFGNRCDADFNQDGAATGADFSYFVLKFNTNDALADLNGDGVVSGKDYSILVFRFNTGPGPSGLSCADPTIDVGMGDPPCTP